MLVKTIIIRKKIVFSKIKKKSLFVSLLFLLKDLFDNSFLTIQYILKNKIYIIILINIYATRFDFINKKFTEIVCQTFKIELQYLIKPKFIQRFDSKAA